MMMVSPLPCSSYICALKCIFLIVLTTTITFTHAWNVGPTTTSSLINTKKTPSTQLKDAATMTPAVTAGDGSSSSESVFTKNTDDDTPPPLNELKLQILQLGAAMDRGQAFNPTSGEYYRTNMNQARSKIETLLQYYSSTHAMTKLSDMEGEWELVFSTVEHGIFRSSPFFLAVQEAFQQAEETTAFDQDKAQLFFKLHELQTCSWGVSKVGRVAQHVDAKENMLYSTFDTSIFSLTVIPIIGWWKLLPTFGGCVVTAAKVTSVQEANAGAKVSMTVDYTTSEPVPGLSGLGKWIWSIRVPVGAIWRLLPWNKGREATCSITVPFVDDDVRIVQDVSGEYFVYTRPVVSRPLAATSRKK